MVYIYLDSDESQQFQVKNIQEINHLDDLKKMCKKKFKLPSLDENNYGFKTKEQGILLADIGDINKQKKIVDADNLMVDKDYYDNNLDTDNLIFTNLIEEADSALTEIQTTTKELKKISAAQGGQPKKIRKTIKEKHTNGRMRKVSYNVKADLDVFVSHLVKKDAIKSLMVFIEESQICEDLELVYIATQILSTLF